MATASNLNCLSSRCPRRGVGNEAAMVCRCGAGFCNEACWIQAWHAGHQAQCPHAYEFMVEAAQAKSSRGRGAVVLARLALRSRRAACAQVSANDSIQEASEMPGIPVTSGNMDRLPEVAPTSEPEVLREMARRSSTSSSASSPPGSAQTLRSSSSMGDFEHLAELGSGAFGTVTKVAHKRTGEIFALKVINRQRVEEHQFQKYIDSEVTTQRSLNHPNIVRLYDSFENPGYFCLLLEYAPDGHLFSRIRKSSRLLELEAARIMMDVCRALVHLHHQGIAHRDVKPENVLLFPGGRAKLADFGWCTELTHEGRRTFCGTMDYLSPEMVLRRPHDHRVDTWAAGVLLYEMLAGEPPFQAKSTIESVQRILIADIKLPTIITPIAGDLIRCLIQVDPNDRILLKHALCHTWFQNLECYCAPEVPIPTSGTNLGASASITVASPLRELGVALDREAKLEKVGKKERGHDGARAQNPEKEENKTKEDSWGTVKTSQKDVQGWHGKKEDDDFPNATSSSINVSLGVANSCSSSSSSMRSSFEQSLEKTLPAGLKELPLPVADPDSQCNIPFSARSRGMLPTLESSLVPIGTNWGDIESKNISKQQSKPFLLASCLHPKSDLFPVNPKKQQLVNGALPEQQVELPSNLHQKQTKSWGETNLYTSVRAWIRGTGPHVLSNELDQALLNSPADAAKPSDNQPTATIDPSQSKGPLGNPIQTEAVGTRARGGIIAAAMSARSSYPTSSSSNYSYFSESEFSGQGATDADLSTDCEDERVMAMGRIAKLAFPTHPPLQACTQDVQT